MPFDNEPTTKAAFLEEVSMARLTKDALLVQAALRPGITESMEDLAMRVFGAHTASSRIRTQSACAALVKFDRVTVTYDHGRVSHVASKDTEHNSWRQLDGSMNLSARAGHQVRLEEQEDNLRDLYGEP